MESPVFPKAFLKHCPKITEAKDWHQRLNVDECDIESFAECAFHQAGAGMECENCQIFLTRPFLHHELDREFLPQIEEYYRKLAEYEKRAEKNQKKEEAAQVELGVGI